MACGQEGQVVCPSCLPAVAQERPASCYSCDSPSMGGATCARCLEASSLLGVVVAGRYTGHLQQLIGQLKYHGQQSLAARLGQLLVAQLSSDQFDLVTSVPAASSRLLRRGYNQAELLARVAANGLGLPYVDLLTRTGDMRQVGHTRAERLSQAALAYRTRGSRLASGARVLVVDDVVTTGATLSACASRLQEAGADQVWGAVLAKH